MQAANAGMLKNNNGIHAAFFFGCDLCSLGCFGLCLCLACVFLSTVNMDCLRLLAARCCPIETSVASVLVGAS